MIAHTIIFPWNENFDTGIEVIDTQHRRLVDLLNNLAGHLAYGEDALELNRVFEELAEYAIYHFKTEEGVWNKWLPKEEMSLAHEKTHQDFVTDVLKLKSDLDELGHEQVVGQMVSFLTHWLAFHILEADKHIAKVVLSLQQGMSLQEAKEKASGEMRGAIRVLIETILKMYDNLSFRTLELMREIAARQRIEQRLRLSKNVIDSTLESIFVSDADFRIIDTNPSFCMAANLPHEQLLGMRMIEVMPHLFNKEKNDEILSLAIEHGHWAGEVIGHNSNGERDAVWLTLSAIKDSNGNVTQFVGVQSSISRLLERQHGLAAAANHDTLTGLPNRRLLNDRLHQAIIRTGRSNRNLAICFLDLDGFKNINDTQGHSAGDAVLRVIAARISKVLRGDDTVARLGGDEFVLLIGDIEFKAIVSKLLSRLLDDIAQPIMIEGAPAKVTASIGITLYPEDNCGADELLRHADQAMYVAKNNGKAKFHFHR